MDELSAFPGYGSYIRARRTSCATWYETHNKESSRDDCFDTQQREIAGLCTYVLQAFLLMFRSDMLSCLLRLHIQRHWYWFHQVLVVSFWRRTNERATVAAASKSWHRTIMSNCILSDLFFVTRCVASFIEAAPLARYTGTSRKKVKEGMSLSVDRELCRLPSQILSLAMGWHSRLRVVRFTITQKKSTRPRFLQHEKGYIQYYLHYHGCFRRRAASSASCDIHRGQSSFVYGRV